MDLNYFYSICRRYLFFILLVLSPLCQINAQEKINIDDFVYNNGYKYREIIVSDSLVSIVPGLFGPSPSNMIKSPIIKSVSYYDKGLSSRLCVYLTDTISSWLQLAESLKAQGIPYRITKSLDEALEHQVVLIYPELSSRNLDLTSFKKLKKFPTDGGVLICFKPDAPSMQSIFGYKSLVKSRSREQVVFSDQLETSLQLSAHEGNPGIVQIVSKTNPLETVGYSETDYLPLAEYDDGSAAIIQKIYNSGAAYGIGFDPAELSASRQIDQGNPSNFLSNIYNQPVDIIFWLIKKVFQNHSDHPVILGMVPEFKLLPIIITHHVTSRIGLRSAILYQNLEANNGIVATYFIQSKYIKDTQGTAFFNPNNIQYLRKLSNNGMEIASTGVSNTPFFGYMNPGTGLESYPAYRPVITSETSGFNETLMGELQVSKFLLEYYLSNSIIQSFSSPTEKIHKDLYTGMEVAGYEFSTCAHAAQVQTYLPYYNQETIKGNRIGEILEIPVTLSAQEVSHLEDPLSSTVFRLSNIEQFGGVATISIKPNLDKVNIEYEKQLINHYIDDAWFTTVKGYGEWWKARSMIELDVETTEDFTYVNLYAPK
ncbi:MAG: hypothetical protein HOG34_13345, partial [Bacteroidetes bacterium]|nr:hypothetical protein [Bacteroidota bacterium]